METSELPEIKSKIRRLRSNGKFVEGANFIQSLSPEIRNAICVAIEAAQLYLVQGHLRSAADVCERTSTSSGLKHKIKGPDSGPDVAAFKLMHAYINILRYSKLKTALKTARLAGGAWKLNDEDQASDGKNFEAKCDGSQDSRCVKIDSERPKKPQNGDDLNEYRILLEFYYWKILVAAAEQGLLEEKSTKARAIMKIGNLRKRMQSAGRFREARHLIYFEAGMMTSDEDAIKELGEFVELIADKAWNAERASSLVDLGERQVKSTDSAVIAAAEESFQRADELFTQIDHGFGCIDVEHTRLSADKTLSSGERFACEVRIANLYFDVGQMQNGIRCLVFAISPEMVLDLYGGQVIEALDQLHNKIEESGSEMLRQISLIHSVTQASLKAPEYGFALRSIESYYCNLPVEIGPKHHTHLATALALIYNSFGEYAKALKAAEEGLEVAKCGAEYEVISDAVLMVGHSKIQLADSNTTNSQEAESLIERALDLLKEWADRDAEKGYVDGEVNKCYIIGSCENFQAAKRTTSTSTTIGPVEQPWVDRIKRYIPDSLSPLKRWQIVDLEVRMCMRQMRYSESMEISNKYLHDLDQIADVHPFVKAQASIRSAIQSYTNANSVFQSRQSLSPEAARSAVHLMWTSLKIAINALELCRKTDGAEIILDWVSFIWVMLRQMLVPLKDSDAKTLLEAFMSELLKTERLSDQMRRSVIPVGGLKDLMNKRLLVSKAKSLELHRIGVDVSLRLDDAASAWNWLQKGKARAFGDSLGASSLIPESLLEKISSDRIALDLLKQE
jgi:tetratricopeptide (TPR) repeat protein